MYIYNRKFENQSKNASRTGQCHFGKKLEIN